MFKTCKKPPMSIISASGSICTFNALQEGLPLKSHKIALTATQSGSGTPSPDNVRTINGYSAINIGATGLNLIGLNTRASGTDLGITSEIQADNRIIATGRSTGNADISFTLANNILLKGGQPYTFSLNGTDTRSNSIYFFIHVVGDGYANYTIPSNAHSVTFTTSRDVLIDSCFLRTFNGGTVDIDAKAQLEVGSTAHAFESYIGNAYTIQIGSTVYGGEYDARTGVLTVTHGVVDLGTLNWNKYTSKTANKTYFRTSAEISDCKKSTSVNITHGLTCSNYVEGAWTYVLDDIGYDLNFALGWGRKSYIAIYDTSKSEMTTDDFKTAMNGVQLMYPLTTPITIQLPPCPIDARFGLNNIFADCGSTTLEAIKIGR